MDHEMIDRADFGYFELARRLEAYADQRLSPSVAATTRMRTAVMNAAHRRAALIEADATFDAAGATTSARAAQRAAAARTAWRRPVAAVMAGCLTLALLTGTALAARPGGPLYAARIWTEMANLPGNLLARAEAEVTRLEDRIDEAQQAATAGDISGTEAALTAYSTIVVEAADGIDGDPAASAALTVSVKGHMAVLTLMVDSVPAPARAAAQQALSSSTMALDDLGGSGQKGGDAGHGVGIPTSAIIRSPGSDQAANDSNASKTGDAANASVPASTNVPAKGKDPAKTGDTAKVAGTTKVDRSQKHENGQLVRDRP